MFLNVLSILSFEVWVDLPYPVVLVLLVSYRLARFGAVR